MSTPQKSFIYGSWNFERLGGPSLPKSAVFSYVQGAKSGCLWKASRSSLLPGLLCRKAAAFGGGGKWFRPGPGRRHSCTSERPAKGRRVVGFAKLRNCGALGKSRGTRRRSGLTSAFWPERAQLEAEAWACGVSLHNNYHLTDSGQMSCLGFTSLSLWGVSCIDLQNPF